WGLLHMADVKAGEWVGLTAPSSSVSQLVVALANMRGVRTIAIEAGAGAGIPEGVRKQTGGDGLSALLDSVGGPLVAALFPALRPGATIVAYGTLSAEPILVRNATLIYQNLTWRGFGIDRWLADIDAGERAHMLEALLDAIRAGRLPLPVHAQFPLA